MSNVPSDYDERVYAGVLGKIIGVYLGRPFEGWTNERIERELGEIHYYVHEKLGAPLIVADDDISGTFTFLRALPDNGTTFALTAEQIGDTWLNYLVENRTVLWWGGMGLSTEHTAYLRLKAGIPAPRSGSIELNGKVVAEQIGAQIFIDGWAMVCPGDPEQAAELARRAASVSHDGEAIYGAQVVAAMEAQAFVERDLQTLLATAQGLIPRDSIISHLIDDIRQWHADAPHDWRATLRRIEKRYGYDTYGGNCHMIPNHAVILLALLYGEDDFQRSLMIANTAGWDTDCNSANVGCLMGIKNGLASINRRVDFRGPVADRMYVVSADGGRTITDAVRETYHIVNIGRTLRGLPPVAPNGGTRFHFNLPGSVHGFVADSAVDAAGTLQVANEHVIGDDINSAADERMLGLHYQGVGPGRIARVSTATFLPSRDLKSQGYALAACPTLYSGQTVRARIVADGQNRRHAEVGLFVRVYGAEDRLEILRDEPYLLEPGASHHLNWEIPDTGGRPIAEVGLEIGGASGAGTVYLDWLHWSGAPRVTLKRPDAPSGDAWRKAWVNAIDQFDSWGQWAGMTYKAIQNEGTGLLIQGESSWQDYVVATEAYPHLADRIGLCACVRGLRRYVALTLAPDGKARLVEQYDSEQTVLAEADMEWTLDHVYQLAVSTRRDGRLEARVRRADSDAETAVLTARIQPVRSHGAVGLQATVAHAQFGAVRVEPLWE